jgi:hypothetical protein
LPGQAQGRPPPFSNNIRRGVRVAAPVRNCALGRDDEDCSRGTICPSFCKFVCASSNRGRRECRVRAAPAVSCAKEVHIGAHEHTGQRKHSDIPCAMALRLTPRSPRRRIRLVTVICELAAALARLSQLRLRRLSISNGCQDHTASPYAGSVIRLVTRKIAHGVHPALQSPARLTLRVHRIPWPA